MTGPGQHGAVARSSGASPPPPSLAPDSHSPASRETIFPRPSARPRAGGATSRPDGSDGHGGALARSRSRPGTHRAQVQPAVGSSSRAVSGLTMACAIPTGGASPDRAAASPSPGGQIHRSTAGHRRYPRGGHLLQQAKYSTNSTTVNPGYSRGSGQYRAGAGFPSVARRSRDRGRAAAGSRVRDDVAIIRRGSLARAVRASTRTPPGRRPGPPRHGLGPAQRGQIGESRHS